jgi:hypothetical protein
MRGAAVMQTLPLETDAIRSACILSLMPGSTILFNDKLLQHATPHGEIVETPFAQEIYREDASIPATNTDIVNIFPSALKFTEDVKASLQQSFSLPRSFIRTHYSFAPYRTKTFVSYDDANSGSTIREFLHVLAQNVLKQYTQDFAVEQTQLTYDNMKKWEGIDHRERIYEGISTLLQFANNVPPEDKEGYFYARGFSINVADATGELNSALERLASSIYGLGRKSNKRTKRNKYKRTKRNKYNRTKRNKKSRKFKKKK